MNLKNRAPTMASDPGSAYMRLLLIDMARRTHIGHQVPRWKRNQWKPTAALEALQLKKLNQLLRFAADNVPYYRARLADPGSNGRFVKSFQDLERIPVSTKQAMRQSPEDFRPLPNVRTRYEIRKTGGSTGDPFTYRVSTASISGQWASIFRAWGWSGYKLGHPMATLGGGSVSPTKKMSLSERVYHGLRGNTPIPCSAITPAGLRYAAGRLLDLEPRMVYGYPSILYQLARHLLDRDLRIPGVNSVVTTSEMLFPGQRKVLEQAFAAPVFNFYGCNEPDLISGECNHHNGLHVAMESSFVEILDDEDQPVPDGQVGRIIATGLDNRATAFIRYDTGDLGALDRSPCACGRGLVRLQDIQGRSRDLVRKPDGTLIHGVAFNQVVFAFPWIDRYQVIQENENRLVMNIACGNCSGPEDKDRLRRAVVDLTELEVELVTNQPFCRTSGQKTRVIISRLEEHLDS